MSWFCFAYMRNEDPIGIENPELDHYCTSFIYVIIAWSLLLFYYYQIYQLGTGRRTQKAQACTRCLPIAKGT